MFSIVGHVSLICILLSCIFIMQNVQADHESKDLHVGVHVGFLIFIMDYLRRLDFR